MRLSRQDLNTPWGIEELTDDLLIVTERPGKLRLVKDGRVLEPILGVPEVGAYGQGGLLDVALANDFEKSGIIFLTYVELDSEGLGTVLAKAKLLRDPSPAKLENFEIIFSMNNRTGHNRHFGSRIAIASDDSIFFSIGDRAESGRGTRYVGICRLNFAN